MRTQVGIVGASPAGLRRVWLAQRFSWWMTSMPHRFPGAGEFDERRQLAELEFVTGSAAAATALAETCVGQPFGA